MPHVALTPALVEQLQPAPGQRRTAYHDVGGPDSVPGLCVRVSATARVYYLRSAHPDVAGDELWVRLGDTRALTLEDARRAARARAGDVARGVDPTAARRRARQTRVAARLDAQRGRITVAELVRGYIDARRRELAHATEADYQRCLDVEIAARSLGRRRADLVTRGDLREFLARIRERPAPRTADRVLAILRAAWRWGLDEELAPGVSMVERDPTRKLELGEPVLRRRHLSDEEIPRAWHGWARLGVEAASFLRLLLLLGLRRGEALAARWEHVDLAAAAWRIPSSVRKLPVGKRASIPDLQVPLPPLALEVLGELRAAVPAGAPRLFAGVSSHTIGMRAQAASGIPDVTIHDLRRSCAAGLERIGCPPHIISMALGHEGTRGASQADLHYVMSRRPVELRTWLERWGVHVRRLVEAADEKGSRGGAAGA